MQWQPIETAPIDVPVLIWDGKMMATAQKDNACGMILWFPWGASGWECENDFEEPTHWTPLPEPPK